MSFYTQKFQTKKYSEQLEGHYLVYKNVFRINLFQLYTEFSFFRSWYFTDSPIAILCINHDFVDSVDSYYDFEESFNAMSLEISLLETAGITVVICFLSSVSNFVINHINKLFDRHEIAEFHIFVYEKNSEYFDKDMRSHNHNSIIDGIDNLYEKI